MKRMKCSKGGNGNTIKTIKLNEMELNETKLNETKLNEIRMK